MTGRLAGGIGVVTGAGSGIGRAAALALAREGAAVVVSDVHEDGGTETVELVRRADGDARFVRADVSNADDVDALIRRTIEAYGRLDYAFNNAGIEGALATTAEYPREAWDRVLAVNLTGVWLCMRAELRQMQQQGGGAIVNNASILGMVGFANAPAYTASKHGMLGLTKVAALEYATAGIRVNAVCPGFIETPMVMERGVHAGTDKQMYEQIAALHPMGRLGRAEEIADTVVWLCSHESSFVTGQAILVDGGYTAR